MQSILALGLLAGQALAALPPITAKGSKFFDSNGDQFYIKGVAYQLTNDDPLAQSQCKLDADLMKTLGANSIRVYHVDPTANHDECMKAFDDAGIYIWLDLDTFSSYIEGPGISTPRWNETQYKQYQAVMDAFHSYDNLAGFFVGNEVLTTAETSVAAPYVKAAGRDMKAYRDAKGYRKIPIGYTAADVAVLRPMLQNYLACGSNQSEALDFFGLNAYEWCGQATYETSGYQFLQQNASDYNIPIFFSETGCNTPKPRTFDDQAAIFGDEMSGTWSGAIIYEWIQEANDYGLISYGPTAAATAAGSGVIDGYTRVGTPTPISPDFDNLSNHWKTLSPSGVKESDYSPSLSPVACPSYTSGAWMVTGTAPLPTLGQEFSSNGGSSATSGGSGSGGSGGSATGSDQSSATGTDGSGSGGGAEASNASGSGSGAASSSAGAVALRGVLSSNTLGFAVMGWVGVCSFIGMLVL